jgi:hypothetical protein
VCLRVSAQNKSGDVRRFLVLLCCDRQDLHLCPLDTSLLSHTQASRQRAVAGMHCTAVSVAKSVRALKPGAFGPPPLPLSWQQNGSNVTHQPNVTCGGVVGLLFLLYRSHCFIPGATFYHRGALRRRVRRCVLARHRSASPRRSTRRRDELATNSLFCGKLFKLVLQFRERDGTITAITTVTTSPNRTRATVWGVR